MLVVFPVQMVCGEDLKPMLAEDAKQDLAKCALARSLPTSDSKRNLVRFSRVLEFPSAPTDDVIAERLVARGKDIVDVRMDQ